MTPIAGAPRSIAAGVLVAACFALSLLAGCAGSQLSDAREAAREPLVLSAQEREQMRAGMRAFLESVEGVTKGLAENDRRQIARSARRAGWAVMDEGAVAAALKLPPAFVAVSIDTHQRFDDLAAAASAAAPKAELLTRLGDILANCTSCHATYRLAPR